MPALHLLLIDDEEAFRRTFTETLASQGYTIDVCASGAEALQMLPKTRFDVVILDQLMPDLTGLDLAKRMRGVRDDLPIILVTGYRGPLLDQEARAAGIDQILPKPLDFRRLAEALHAALTATPNRAVTG